MRPIDADKIIFDYSGLVYISPSDCAAIAKYFADQIKEMPTIAPPPNDPLTLEELREMDGEPVYIHWIRSSWQMGGEWAFVCLKWQGCKTADGGAVWFDRYGEWWLAYRRKPEEETT